MAGACKTRAGHRISIIWLARVDREEVMVALMTAVICGIKAFDVHELLCHFLAKRLGFYDDEGIKVRVVDTTFMPDDRLPRTSYVQVACGAAYLSRREGHPFKVVFAAAERPIFWLYARPDIESIERLGNRRVATYPPVAPPHHFLRLLLRKHGLDPALDVELWACRDDIIRVGLLREGDVDAAMLSSALSPETVERLGFRTLALVGDEVRFVTTGLATTESVLQKQPELIRPIVAAHRRSLETIHSAPSEAIAVLAEVLREPHETAERTFERLRHCYTHAGRVSDSVLEHALEEIGGELTTGDEVRAADLYDFSLLEA
jgi:ABC-type nitrate/sulfonate/bicarbonate transport system substrate-binding protein